MRLIDHFRMAIAAGLCVAAGLLINVARGESDSVAIQQYLADVKPVLVKRCYACHGALRQESGLRLDTVELMREAGAGILSVGQPDDSVLLERVSASDLSIRMPPEGEPLSREEVDAIRRWITAGTAAPPDEEPEPDPSDHWAFRLPVAAAVPQIAGPWGQHPVDAFIAAQHQQRGLVPVEEVEKSLLLRRVSLDLTGLPPTRAELLAFLNDASPDAYERVVDRLLDSPQYGERWGRHWMDIWRYSDWYGLGEQLRDSQKHIWHWRDWIVESLNHDDGYDHMVRDMLAADELAPTDAGRLRATGFLARNYYLFNRTTWLDATIEHTSKAFLGLTLNCCKCHDHKYDPLTQTDYYRLRAIFEPHQVRLDSVPGQIDLERDGLPRVFDAHPDAETWRHIRGDEKSPDKSQPIAPGLPGILFSGDFAAEAIDLPLTAHSPGLRGFVLDDHLAAAEQQIATARKELAASRQLLQKLESQATQKKPADDATGEVFLNDPFDAPQPDVWESSSGEWSYADGRLIQTAVGATRRYQRSRREHPRDFVATLKFRTLGGDMWKSVGLSFDVVADREKLVYLSAVNPGSKLQVSYKSGAAHAYPPDGAQMRPVALNEPYEMTIRVRDRLINVSLNGSHAIAYRLPVEREAGRLDLIAFDAHVAFDSLEVRTLPADEPLTEPGPGTTAAPVSVAQARLQLQLAEAGLAAAELRPDMLRAAFAADMAKAHGAAADESVTAAIAAAALAARKHEHAVLAEAVTKAALAVETSVEKDRAKADEALAAAKKALDQAAAKLNDPGTAYASLSATLKALEGPAENDASRRQPYPAISTGRRTALANWIADSSNPLTARVAVNHIWLRHFGQPLVSSVDDFGRRSPQPPQHALLDWLAVDFMKNGWKMKHLHRLLVTSRTYRLSTSTLHADNATRIADSQNDYHWRRTPTRMESQAVRDSVIHLAGALDLTLGGPTIVPNQNNTVLRRSLYFTHSRDDQDQFLSMFDDASILQCYRRSESVIPQQALTLANSRLSLDMSRRIAAMLQSESTSNGSDAADEAGDAAFIRSAFETVLCRQPDPEETAACQQLLNEVRETLKDNPARDARAGSALVHALFNHNDFVSVR